MSRCLFLALPFFPQCTFRGDESCQCFCITNTSRTERAIAANTAFHVINRFAVASKPDLAWRKIEVHKVSGGLDRQETLNLVCNYLAANINHLYIWHVVVFLIIAQWNVGLLIHLNTLLEIH